MERAGWQRYSIRLPWFDGKWYYVSYSNWGPLAYLFGAASSIAEAYKYGLPGKDRGMLDMTRSAGRRFFGVIKDMSYVQGFLDVANLFKNFGILVTNQGSTGDQVWERRRAQSEIARYAGNIATSFVPVGALANTIAQAQDPYMRSTEGGSIRQQIANRIPNLGPPGSENWPIPGLPDALKEDALQGNMTGRRQGLPINRDVLGRPIMNPNSGVFAILPFRATAENMDNDTINILNAAEVGIPSPTAEVWYDPDGKGKGSRPGMYVLLPPSQREALAETAGPKIEAKVAEIQQEWPPSASRRTMRRTSRHFVTASRASTTKSSLPTVKIR